MARYFVGVDNGGTMSKAAVFTEDGRELAAAARKVDILEPHPGWSERDMGAMWRGTAEAIREAISKAGVDAAEIACVACTGHGNGLYLIGPDGKPVRNGINSMDGRAAAIIAQWKRDGVDARDLSRGISCAGRSLLPPGSSSRRSVSAMRLRATSTSSTLTLTMSPDFTTSRGSLMNDFDIAEMCTSPS